MARIITDEHTLTQLEVGKPAPRFSGACFHDGKIAEISLEGLKGKWVLLYFYPADFTFVCPTELGDVADVHTELEGLEVTPVSVSTDTEWAHKVWADISPVIKKVAYPMLADPTGEVSRAYGVYNEETGLAQRGRFIIDPDGVLRAVEITDGPVGRDVHEAIRQIKALQFIRANPGVACPAKWKKSGDDTLTPSAELAGKI